MVPHLGLVARQPVIKVSQYTSPNRQMSLPASENELGADATLPWLLSPKWTPSELALSRKRSTKPPKEALAEISKLYLLLQPQFDYPSLQFEDGEPVMTEPYAETQHHLTKLQELLDDLEALKVSREDEDRKVKLAGDIRRLPRS
ncbi:hypothetical protein RSOLAG1IB_03179 [Rhizoctonia solani AG-1 IB]|uniref:Uncharacterized protein n=1 Tax=Thanatephorus cucumeris (strain AG1-IB / isolate 7/3/14) TaxID=1108050 RepID=A0A0B7FMS0_THACB|nr:hypothetical protein RSOLAG1IB_03179 [Rhizoctonia solani AG-1 IB]